MSRRIERWAPAVALMGALLCVGSLPCHAAVPSCNKTPAECVAQEVQRLLAQIESIAHAISTLKDKMYDLKKRAESLSKQLKEVAAQKPVEPVRREGESDADWNKRLSAYNQVKAAYESKCAELNRDLDLAKSEIETVVVAVNTLDNKIQSAYKQIDLLVTMLKTTDPRRTTLAEARQRLTEGRDGLLVGRQRLLQTLKLLPNP